MTFTSFVQGASVAIVGPAAPVGDQTAAVDSHDLVARVNFTTHRPDGYGQRCDIAYLNGGLGRTIHDDGAYWGAEDATWWVFKMPNGHRTHGLHRTSARVPIENPHAVTMALYDLLKAGAGMVSVFGADMYASPGDHYHPDYPNAKLHTIAQLAEAIRLHKPWENRRVHRWALATGKVMGDDRYLAAVNMSDDEYRGVLGLWATYEELDR
jgi:hypothetical protein